VKCKKYVYCKDCIKAGKFLERICINCGEAFKAEKDYQHYCSIKCSNSRNISEETKNKIKNTLLNKYKDKPKKIKIKKGFTKVTYEELKETIENKGCKLLISKDEYSIMKGNHKKVKIISSCGHIIDNCAINEFKSRGTGIKCKSCVLIEMKDNAIKNSKDDNGSVVAIQIEYKSYTKIKSLIENEFNVERTVEGCLVDLIIRPKTEDKNLWLPIQLKATSVATNIYTFHLQNTYTNMLLLLHSLQDNKIWCINGNQVQNQQKFQLENISLNTIYI
jgi:hypothetical protein